MWEVGPSVDVAIIDEVGSLDDMAVVNEVVSLVDVAPRGRVGGVGSTTWGPAST